MKILFFLLLTLFFATIGFAEVSHQSDESNKKIEKIEEKLDTTKEELIKYTQITEDTKDRVGDINSSVDQFGILVTFFGVLITGIIIYFSIRSTKEAKLEAKEEAQKLLGEWIKKREGDFEKKEEYFEKIMNDKIKLFEDNVDVKTIQIMFENAVGYDRNKQYSEALKVYNEIINSYGNSQNETILIKVAQSIFSKGFTLTKQDKADEAFKIYEKFITTYKDSKIERIREALIITIQNKLEIEVILDKPISNGKIIIIEELNQTPKDMAIVDMLLLFQNAKISSQDTELQLWLEQYKDVKITTWGFDELEKWITNATYSDEVKQRIQSYIETFKTHLHRA